MKRLPVLLVPLLLSLSSAAGRPETPRELSLQVSETAGLRRYGYPVTATAPFPPGALCDAGQAALCAGGTPLRGVQYDVLSRWPDHSVRWLRLSFNLSPGPREKQELKLRFGPGVAHPDPGPPVVRETPELFDLRGQYRIPRAGPAFLTSVRYGEREFLKAPAAWTLWERGVDGQARALRPEPGASKSRVLSAGPVNAVVELTGSYPASGGAVPYRLTLSQPNSKSWFRAVFEAESPRGDLAGATLSVPYALEKSPARYDCGVGSWVYGTLRAQDAVLLEAGRREREWRL
ncbi:MAG TPA: hypothetical protein VFU47_13155, partial [Armatimonadota bacterium]|nr:hypothetical protein [Armatimonadota bacterium]